MNSLPLAMQRCLPKHAKLKFALQERLKKLQAGQPLPSISALKTEYDMCQGTVTRVLRELQADGLVEARNGSGVYATGRVHLKTIAIRIGFDVLAPQAGVFPGLLLKGLETAVGQFEDVQYRHYFASGTGVLWPERICTLEQDVRRHLVDGVITLGVLGGEFGDLQAPVVAALVAPPGITCHVNLDIEALIGRAMAALKARDCRRAALLGQAYGTQFQPDDYRYATARLAQQRIDFFRNEARRLGLATRPEWLCGVEETGVDQLVPSSARAFTAGWQAFAEKPDALICLDDYMATGAIQAMRQLGVEPGRDIQVATHANRGSNVLDGLPVMAIEFDPAEIARTLVETVHKLIDGERVPATVLVPPAKLSRVL